MTHEDHDSLHRHEPGKPVPRDLENERDADGPADVTPSAQGLGAVWGDAERTPNPGPVKPPSADDVARMQAVAEEYTMETTEEGERYLTPRDVDAGSPATTDEYPDS
jgi:hypothetical protein